VILLTQSAQNPSSTDRKLQIHTPIDIARVHDAMVQHSVCVKPCGHEKTDESSEASGLRGRSLQAAVLPL